MKSEKAPTTGKTKTPKEDIGFLYRHILSILALVFAIGLGSTIWYISRLQSNLIETMALENAALYSQALAEFRTLYTQEVVERVRPRGIQVRHDYETVPGSIPLPATLSILLGKRIGEHASGAEAQLYSPYPFPWREPTGGLRDDFSKEAWTFLSENPTETFFRFEEYRGRRSLRFATADLMRASCVSCHNEHPSTPRNDWKVGDVRGVLEVIRPLDSIVAQTREGLRGTFVLLAVMSTLALSAFGLVIGRLRRNARNLQETTATKERIETELRVASDIQMSTMPKIFPPFPDRKDFGIHATIKPALEVGGDFFNFELVQGDKLFFVIGDVSGKGVHAALFMAVANTLIQTAARTGLTPDEVLGVANRQLSRDNDSCMFVTVFCGLVDLGSGGLTFSNAGHNPPYLLSDDDGVTPMEQASGLVLGLNPDSEYSSHTLALRPGDGLFLYTDGVTEAMAKDGEMFGESRVESFLTRYRQADAKKIVETALENVKRFTAGAPQSDDITLLALRYRPPVPPT